MEESKIAAFGVARHEEGRPKNPVMAIEEINNTLVSRGISTDNVVSIQMDEAFYHVFYKT